MSSEYTYVPVPAGLVGLDPVGNAFPVVALQVSTSDGTKTVLYIEKDGSISEVQKGWQITADFLP